MEDFPWPTVSSLLKDNLYRVFNERSPSARASAISSLFTQGPVWYEKDTIIRGRYAIRQRAQQLLDEAPKEWVFYTDGEVKECQGLGIMRWRFGPKLKEEEEIKWDDKSSEAVFGTDVILVDESRIAKVWTIFEARP